MRSDFWIGCGCFLLGSLGFVWGMLKGVSCPYCLKQRLILILIGLGIVLCALFRGPHLHQKNCVTEAHFTKEFLNKKIFLEKLLWLSITGLAFWGMMVAYTHLSLQINVHLIGFTELIINHASLDKIESFTGALWLLKLVPLWSLLLFSCVFLRGMWRALYQPLCQCHPLWQLLYRLFCRKIFKKPSLIFLVTLCQLFLHAPLYTPLHAHCVGRFVNPISDICWECLFPLHIAGQEVVRGKTPDPKDSPRTPLCSCRKGALRTLGIPIGFWEPVRLVDVTRTPYCLVNMGGVSLADTGIKGRGDVGENTDLHKTSFYHVHWYIYPVIYWLEVLTDFVCLEKLSFDLAYVSELDPFWAEDEKSALLNPEGIVFGNIIAQAACVADCVQASLATPFNSLFWCQGCQGSLYPFTGTIPDHEGGVQGSLLAMGRMMAKLHREMLLWNTSGKAALCDKQPAPFIKKSQYRTQMTYPLPQTDACAPLGKTEVFWGAGKEFPYKGSDFGYLIWRKRDCCLPLVAVPAP